MFKSWNELSEVEQLQCTYSDMHKDVYGFRPRGDSTEDWNSAEFLKAQLDYLAAELESVIAREKEAEAESIRVFENAINDCLKAGAKDRAMAIRWLKEAIADEMCGDEGYFEFHYGLPYGYLKIHG